MTCLNDYLAINLDKSKVFHGSNLEVLPFMADNSVDAIVTDPPYELGFMGKAWDNSGIAYSVELWRECLRVLKPGGHLLAFGGSRTWHRLAVAIEDAGFEMRDSIAWLYGSGFPKSLDIAKAIDKAAGVEREIVGTHNGSGLTRSNVEQGAQKRNVTEWAKYSDEPATPEAQQWQGWGTALKPAFEPIVVARKPLTGTVAQNVLEWGTGGLNIDASRIEAADQDVLDAAVKRMTGNAVRGQLNMAGSIQIKPNSASGRWPANIILDEYTAELLDEQSGVTKSTGGRIGKKDTSNIDFGLSGKYEKGDPGFGDVGGASRYFKVINGKENDETSNGTVGAGNFGNEITSTNSGESAISDGVGEGVENFEERFFYQPKASKRDRNEGLEELEATSAADMVDREADSAGMNSPRAGAGRTSGAKNFHPTVKPTTLMTYLINLVTPPNGTVLDPFTGSGSTGKAAVLSGYNFIGIELTADYLPIIEGRLIHAEQQTAERLI